MTQDLHFFSPDLGNNKGSKANAIPESFPPQSEELGFTVQT